MHGKTQFNPIIKCFEFSDQIKPISILVDCNDDLLCYESIFYG